MIELKEEIDKDIIQKNKDIEEKMQLLGKWKMEPLHHLN